MSNELKPCPFCGQQDAFVEQLDSDSSVVICQGIVDKHSACLARGPVGVQQDESEDQPGHDEAVKLWNETAQPAAPVTTQQPVAEVLHNAIGCVDWIENPHALERGTLLYTRTDAECIALLERNSNVHCKVIHDQGVETAGLRAQLAERNTLLTKFAEFLEWCENADVGAGYCVCGDDLQRHGTDHSPVDMWAHSLSLWAKELRSLSASAEPSAPVDERAEFEAFASTHAMLKQYGLEKYPVDGEDYDAIPLQGAYDAWQARAKLNGGAQ
jgi:hypothetical protein